MIAEASFGSSILFPVGMDAYKEFFSIREAPRKTATGRKNPILHFCQKYVKGTGKKVEGHWKGTDTIYVDGLGLRIHPSL